MDGFCGVLNQVMVMNSLFINGSENECLIAEYMVDLEGHCRYWRFGNEGKGSQIQATFPNSSCCTMKRENDNRQFETSSKK